MYSKEVGKEIHLVCFRLPYPPDSGGVMDSFFRIKALSDLGVRIHLHVFVYGVKSDISELNNYCVSVHTYKRNFWRILRYPLLPVIVSSRMDTELLRNLNKDRLPVLFDGLHTTGWIQHFHDRSVFLRAHNVESEYYTSLVPFSKGINRIYLQWESYRLKQYEKSHLNAFTRIFTISESDKVAHEKLGGKCTSIPIFHGYDQVDISLSCKDFLLYQGDLSLPVNQNALIEVLDRNQIPAELPLIVAGKNGGRAFEEKLAQFPNLQRKVNVTTGEMRSLVKEARMVIVPSLHTSGMKQKLFPPLYLGHWIIASPENSTFTDLDKLLELVPVNSFRETILAYWHRKFGQEEIDNRRPLLEGEFSDSYKAKSLISYL